MPIVLASRVAHVFYIQKEESLGEILGHSDFDGYPFSIGDSVIFEDETVSRIEHDSSQKFYILNEFRSISLSIAWDMCKKLEADFPIKDVESWTLTRFFNELSELPEPKRRIFRNRWSRT